MVDRAPSVASGMHDHDDHMASDTTTQREQPRRRGWDRRRDHGRRIVRDRRRETVEVEFERRARAERRSGLPRRARSERRTPPEGFTFLDR
jgi:hypothetical protein